MDFIESIEELEKMLKDAKTNRSKEDPCQVNQKWEGFIEGVEGAILRLVRKEVYGKQSDYFQYGYEHAISNIPFHPTNGNPGCRVGDDSFVHYEYSRGFGQGKLDKGVNYARGNTQNIKCGKLSRS
jgi:hypothetical protein